MTCPECEAAGVQTRAPIESLGTEQTCLGWLPFIDAAGSYHSHDPNRHWEHFRCWYGHRFSRQWQVRCASCAYGGEVG